MKEIWKIEGMEDFTDYYITTCGRVLSTKQRKVRIMRDAFRPDGYMRVVIKKSNGRGQQSFYTHRLVAMAYIPNPENKGEVNHIDERRSNNHVINLEWSTRLENVHHGTGLVRRGISQSGEGNGKSRSIKSYETTPTTLTAFKRTCRVRGWDYSSFVRHLYSITKDKVVYKYCFKQKEITNEYS